MFQMTIEWLILALLSVVAVVVTSRHHKPVVNFRCYKQKQVVKANSKFGIGLYKKLGSGFVGQNMIFSPLSVSAALAMTYGGAGGSTKTQMRMALRFNGMSSNSVHAGFNSLLNLVQSAVTLNTANKIYIDNSFTLKVSHV